MAKAYKCDICGTFVVNKLSSNNVDFEVKKYRLRTIVHVYRISDNSDTYADICPDCVKKITTIISENL